LVGYPVIDLRKRGRDLHRFLRTLEQSVIRLVEAFGLSARREEGKTGVWVEDRKVASIGVGVRRWITMHGFALNVSSDLSGFQYITPCGLTGVRMTSLSLEIGTEVSVQTARELAGQIISRELAVSQFADLIPAS
jgi:lipoyl(octanoyl) transferase